MARWTEQVKVFSQNGLESIDDGYCWRKYGQKDILGASYPRWEDCLLQQISIIQINSPFVFATHQIERRLINLGC